ncbi:MAG: DUF4395 domain-containing protein [Bacteroidales bacterium]
MKNLIYIICPVSDRKTDENATRIAAVLTAIITVAALAVNSYIILFLLAADFAVRSFTPGTGSLLKILSGQIAGMLDIRNKKHTDAAPKKFAALLGMTFSLLAGVFLVVQLPVAALITASILVFCAFLEGIFGYCLGCLVYSVLTASANKQHNNSKFFKSF